jgi:hypothetical protein
MLRRCWRRCASHSHMTAPSFRHFAPRPWTREGGEGRGGEGKRRSKGGNGAAVSMNVSPWLNVFGLFACAGGTTLGIYEMEDVIAAVRWARKCKAGMKIGLIGTRCVVKRIEPLCFTLQRESASFIAVCFFTSSQCTSRQPFS